MSEETRTRLREAIEQCLRRSTQRQAVIVGLFFDQKGFKELADELRTSVQNIRLLKSRALERLRECEEFLEVLEELL
jgi:DNA-directed RNA polymerase specialized sigma24 family protein